MMMRLTVLAVALGLAVSAAAAARDAAHSSYAGEEAREIKALAPAFVAGLRSGAGLGFAKSAELNGYPGPAHLLDLADRIPLDADQVRAITAIRDDMRVEAIGLGEALITAEIRIEEAFRAGGIDAARLADLTSAAGAARARLRARHLAAHLEAAALLSSKQIAAYEALRGYAPGAESGGQPGVHGAHQHRH